MGISGIGLGHSIRQSVIYEALVARGYQIHIIAHGRSLRFFGRNYPDAVVSPVEVPVLVGARKGIDFSAPAVSRGTHCPMRIALFFGRRRRSRSDSTNPIW